MDGRRFFSTTAVATTLAADCTDTDTTIVIALAQNLPTSYPWSAELGTDTTSAEVVDVTARTGTSCTVVRGRDGTTAVAHAAGTTTFQHTFSGRDFGEANDHINQSIPITIALSDETTAITTGTAKVTFRAPFAMTLTDVPRANVNTVSSSGIVTVDVNVNGTSILHATDKLTVDVGEKTSTTAAVVTSLVTTSISDDDEFTFDIDVAGTGAKGLKVTLFYKRP
jgi:hypothetical protein